MHTTHHQTNKQTKKHASPFTNTLIFLRIIFLRIVQFLIGNWRTLFEIQTILQ